MQTRIYFLHALSPLHPGVGQGIGLIDLPIARDRATGLPLVPGSSVKGVLRDAVRTREARQQSEKAGGQRGGPKSLEWRIFGPDSRHAHEFSSALRVSDARVVLFPVPSDRGTFAWATCPSVLARLTRDAGKELAGFEAKKVPEPSKDGQCLVAPKSALAYRSGKGKSAKEVATLDGLPFEARREAVVEEVARALGRRIFADDPWWADFLVSHIAVVSDDLFAWFTQQATDVRARIRIDPERGTVAKGALWYEEALPAETLLAGVVQAEGGGERRASPEEVWRELDAVVASPIQVGGNATVGAGLVRMRIAGGEA